MQNTLVITHVCPTCSAKAAGNWPSLVSYIEWLEANHRSFCPTCYQALSNQAYGLLAE